MEGDELSAEEPGYVPPDHKTTAEFRIPRKSSPAEPPVDAAESTVVDTPFSPEDTVTDGPLPVDTVDDGPETVTDLPVDTVEPVDDLPVDDLPSDDLPVDDVEELPADGPEPGEWTAVFGQEEPPSRGEPTAPHPGLAGRGGQAPLPMATAAAAIPPRAPSGPEGPTGPAGPPPPVQPQQPYGAPPPAPAAQHAHGGIAPPDNAPAQPAGAPPAQPPLVPPPGGMPPHPPTQPASMGQGPVPPPYAPVGSPVGSPAPPIPPGQPPAGSPARSRSKRGPLIVVAAAVLGVALLGGGLAVALQSGDDDPKKKTGAGTAPPVASATPSPGTTQPGQPPGATANPSITSGPAPTPSAGVAPPPTAPIGPVVKGKNLSYQLVQQDPGYYEGLLIVTNRSSKPMKGWKLTFDAPKSNVTQVWGGELVKGGDKVEIRSLDGAPAIPPGATFEVRFGARGSAVTPRGCEFNDKSCGFK